MLRRSVGQFLHRAPSNRDQHNGNQHDRDVLECPVGLRAISCATEYNKRAHEIKYQPKKKLSVRKDEREETDLIVGSGKRRLAGPAHERFHDENDQQDEYNITYQGMEKQECAVHNDFISPEKYAEISLSF